MFPFAHTINERSGSAQVVTVCSPGKEVGTDALQLIHDSADVLCPFGHLNFCCFLNAHAESMAIDVGREVVEPVRQVQHLGVGHAFT